MDHNQQMAHQQQQFYAANQGGQQQYQQPPQFWVPPPPPPAAVPQPIVQQPVAPVQRYPAPGRSLFDFQLRNDVREIRDVLRELMLVLRRNDLSGGNNASRRRFSPKQ